MQPRWQPFAGLRKDQRYWESSGDGAAPSGVYKKMGENRWKHDETKQVYEEKDGALNPPVKPFDEIGGKSQDYHTRYEAALAWAMRFLLERVSFGGSSDKRKYDRGHWRTSKDRDGDEILVLTSASPAMAIKDIFTKATNWSFDCIEIIQVGRLYAELQAMGDREFNLKKKGTFKISYHETTGLRTRTLYRRERKSEAFVSIDSTTGHNTRTDVRLTTAQEEDAFLQTLPVGTRVMWTDTHEDAFDTDFENENTIKIGVDQFAAHPFGVCSAAKLRKELGPSSSDEPSRPRREAYIRRNVFIKEIEWNARS